MQQKYPEYVLPSGPDAGRYTFREASFWTCGFFPGSIYALIERATKHPGHNPGALSVPIVARLRELGLVWSEPLYAMASRTDTHDMGFMIQPALRRRWELFQEERALFAVVTAAKSLYTRWSDKVGAIRSWDKLIMQGVEITSLDKDFLVIIDSMCNLDLLFDIAKYTGTKELAAAATRHARTLMTSNLRPEKMRDAPGCYEGTMYSTIHVVNFCPETGGIKQRLTAQGYSADSTWARGQAWAILGYAQTHFWTGEQEFLDVACGLAEYFIFRLETAPSEVDLPVPGEQRTKGRYVPQWDFDAPVDTVTDAGPLRDASAGVIAANGMLVLSQRLAACRKDELAARFRNMAVTIVKDTLDVCLATEKAKFVFNGSKISVEDEQPGSTFESILKHSTANHNPIAIRRYWDHGLVYADYYLIEFGNRLLEMGLA